MSPPIILISKWFAGLKNRPTKNLFSFRRLGKLYVKDLASGNTKRLTKQNKHDEYYPNYSLDGKSIVYTTWNDQDLGTIRIIDADGGDEGKVDQPNAGTLYRNGVFNRRQNDHIPQIRRRISYSTPKYSIDSGIYVANLATKEHTRVSKSGSEPHFAGDNSRVYFTTAVPKTDYPEQQLVSVDLNGKDQREHLIRRR